ncbi:MAG: TIGR00730 family Rossman fold protein [Rhodospirillales bacterium]|nr:TIGR00730 family Rossman fold protein [Rhodospirillales bacterium]
MRDTKPSDDTSEPINENGTGASGRSDQKIGAICIFAGSRMGADKRYGQEAERLGRLIAERGIRLIYGGGNIGVMGLVARTVLECGGEVIGIIPNFLMTLEVGNPGVTELITVDTMHERKARMFEMSDAFVVLPGGLGTLDETMEIATWKQLQLHSKPIVAVNMDGFWDPMMGLLNHVAESGFAHSSMPDLVTAVDSIDGVFDAIANAKAPGSEVLLSHLQAE